MELTIENKSVQLKKKSSISYFAQKVQVKLKQFLECLSHSLEQVHTKRETFRENLNI